MGNRERDGKIREEPGRRGGRMVYGVIADKEVSAFPRRRRTLWWYDTPADSCSEKGGKHKERETLYGRQEWN